MCSIKSVTLKIAHTFIMQITCNFLAVAVMVAEVEVVVITVFVAIVGFRSVAIPLIFL
jgi:hypothetical protein